MPSTVIKLKRTGSESILLSRPRSLQDVDEEVEKEVSEQERASEVQGSTIQRQAIDEGRALAEVGPRSFLTPLSPPPLSRRCQRLLPEKMATGRFAPAAVVTLAAPDTTPRSPQRESKAAGSDLDQNQEQGNQQAGIDEECWPLEIMENHVKEQCPFLHVELVRASDENYPAPRFVLTLRGYTETEDEWNKLKSALEKFLGKTCSHNFSCFFQISI